MRLHLLVFFLFFVIDPGHGWAGYGRIRYLMLSHAGRLVKDGAIVYWYNGTITCQYRQNFCALLYYMEIDPPFLDFRTEDYIGFVELQCTTTGQLHHTIMVPFWDDGPGSSFEPWVYIHHNCLPEDDDAKVRITHHELQSVPNFPLLIEARDWKHRLETPVYSYWTAMRYSDETDYITEFGIAEDPAIKDFYAGKDLSKYERLFHDVHVVFQKEDFPITCRVTSQNKVLTGCLKCQNCQRINNEYN